MRWQHAELRRDLDPSQLDRPLIEVGPEPGRFRQEHEVVATVHRIVTRGIGHRHVTEPRARFDERIRLAAVRFDANHRDAADQRVRDLMTSRRKRILRESQRPFHHVERPEQTAGNVHPEETVDWGGDLASDGVQRHAARLTRGVELAPEHGDGAAIGQSHWGSGSEEKSAAVSEADKQMSIDLFDRQSFGFDDGHAQTSLAP